MELKEKFLKMLSLRNIIENYSNKTPVDWSYIEQDYALSWMLYGISQVEKLFDTLVFKGGTCLRKSYFGDYRFSQDLDFSVQGNFPTHNEFDVLIKQAADIASKTLQERGHNIIFTSQRYLEKKPHPENQEAFVIMVQYPWQRTPLTKIMVEITVTEVIYLLVEDRPILHPYDDPLNARIKTYSLEEIVCEKISALLSFNKKLHERGWGRSRARDYYDLWRILSEHIAGIDKSLVSSITPKKCLRKSIEFKSIEDLFGAKLMEDFDVSWTLWVAPLVPNCPNKDIVLSDLKRMLPQLFLLKDG